MTYEHVTREELLANARIPIRVVETEEDLYADMAAAMLGEIEANNARGKNTVFIVPVGPVGQYRVLAERVNAGKTDLRRVYFINMDEYLDDGGNSIPPEHPLSFAAFMDREWYARVNMPRENGIFPEPGHEAEIAAAIGRLGGVDVAFGGIGINGHIAFNEPISEEEISAADFAELPTRVIDLTELTIESNADLTAGGDRSRVPEKAVTMGMEPILAAREILLLACFPEQQAPLARIMRGRPTPELPASYLLGHPRSTIIYTGDRISLEEAS